MSEWRPEPGIYEGVPWDQYKSIPYISPSTLKKGLRSMLHLQRAINGELQPSAKTVAVGQAVHCLIAGEMDRIAVMPEFQLDEANVTATGKRSTSKSTEYFKTNKAAWETKHEGKDVLTDIQMAVARKVAKRIRETPKVGSVLDRSLQELTVIARIEGVMCKTRIDGAIISDGHVWDIKTTEDISGRALYRQCKNVGHLFQFGFHNLACANAGKNAFQILRYDVIAAEVSGDYDTGLILVPPQLLDDWSEKVLRVLGEYRLAHASGNWPGLYPSGIGVLDVPDYDMAENGVFAG